MSLYYGVVKDNRVVLDNDARLADGTRVEVRPEQASARDMMRAEEIVKERLRAAGVLAPAPPSLTDNDEDDDFEPITVEGEPLSQMLLRERR